MIPGSSSFRDPAGNSYVLHDRVLRRLTLEAAAQFETFRRTPSAASFAAQRQIVPTRRLTDTEALAVRDAGQPQFAADAQVVVFEHERIPYRSYPYEWPAEMLWDAGRLTLDLARGALPDGFSLKDATPYNVLFRASEPVFVDVLSFEPRVPGDPVWLPYGQFVRTFLLPLLTHQRWGLALADIFTMHRDGLEPQEVYRFCGGLGRFAPKVFSLVTVPTWLRPKAQAQGQGLYQRRILSDPAKARFILESLLNRLDRSLAALQPKPGRSSTWSDYMATHSYNEPAFAAKEQFVKACLAEFKPARVLDAGANTGHFSALAAQAGAEVVAVDSDAACAGAIWRRARQQRLNILPLVINLARPSPALGWRNRECPSFLERMAGRFDGVLMLALMHHLLVTERIPLEEIFSLAAELTTSWAIIELVPSNDPMFQQLTRGRDHLHADLNQAAFETAASRHFEIVRSVTVPATHRSLYALKRRGGGP